MTSHKICSLTCKYATVCRCNVCCSCVEGSFNQNLVISSILLFCHLPMRLFVCEHSPSQCAVFLGWITGMHPPGKVLRCITAGNVVLNMLKAHCEAYEAIKRTPVGKSLLVCHATASYLFSAHRQQLHIVAKHTPLGTNTKYHSLASISLFLCSFLLQLYASFASAVAQTCLVDQVRSGWHQCTLTTTPASAVSSLSWIIIVQVGLVHHHITFLATGPRLLRLLAE